MLVGAWEVATAQIEAADLPCPVYRTARRLLDLAMHNDGIAVVSDVDLLTICGSKAEGTMRSHLIQMQNAGVLNYTRHMPRHGAQEATTSIQFVAWSNLPLPLMAPAEDVGDEEMIASRSNLIAERSFSEPADDARAEGIKKMIDQRSFTRAERSNLIAQRSFSTSTSHARLGRWVGRSLPSTRTNKKPTYPPKSSQASGPPLTRDQQLAFDLLVDDEVGVIHRVATELARKLPATDIFRAVDKWLPDAQTGKVTAGALKHRLERLVPSDAPTVALSAGFRDSELFQRHRLPDALIADDDAARRRQYRVEAGDYPAGDERRRKYSP